MQYSKAFLGLVAVALMGAGCSPAAMMGAKDSAPQITDQTVTRRADGAEGTCTVNLHYPKIATGRSADTDTNEYIEINALVALNSTDINNDVETAADAWMDRCASSLKESTTFDPTYYTNLSYKINLNDGGLLSLLYTNDERSGDTSAESGLVFKTADLHDLTTGEELDLPDLLKEDQKVTFWKEAWKRIEAGHAASLDEVDGQRLMNGLKNGDAAITEEITANAQDFIATDTGIRLLYSEYEITPQSIEIAFTWAELLPYLQPGTAVEEYAKSK